MDPGRVTMVLWSAGVPAIAGAVSDDKIAFTAMLAATAAVVAGLIGWIDHRIDMRIKDHAKVEQDLDSQRHDRLMSEIRHLRRELKLPADHEVTDPMRAIAAED